MFGELVEVESVNPNAIIPLPPTVQTDIWRRLEHASEDGRLYIQSLISEVNWRFRFHLDNIPNWWLVNIRQAIDDRFNWMSQARLATLIRTAIEKAYLVESLNSQTVEFKVPEIVEIENLYQFLLTASGKEKFVNHLKTNTSPKEESSPEDKFNDYIDILRSILIWYYSREIAIAQEVIASASPKMNDSNTLGAEQIRWSNIIHPFKTTADRNIKRIQELQTNRWMDANAIIVDFQNQ